MQNLALPVSELAQLMVRPGEALVKDNVAYVALDNCLHILIDDFSDATPETFNDKIQEHFSKL